MSGGRIEPNRLIGRIGRAARIDRSHAQEIEFILNPTPEIEFTIRQWGIRGANLSAGEGGLIAFDESCPDEIFRSHGIGCRLSLRQG